jgi:hypothetical protein
MGIFCGETTWVGGVAAPKDKGDGTCEFKEKLEVLPHSLEISDRPLDGGEEVREFTS